MAVADTIEAMSAHRPYRAGLGLDAALNEIERGSGIQYDTVTAEACLTLFREDRYELPA
jgi:HD-GYP domain-containing protein (c-di-GMP phosphodiesterase class II)